MLVWDGRGLWDGGQWIGNRFICVFACEQCLFDERCLHVSVFCLFNQDRQDFKDTRDKSLLFQRSSLQFGIIL